MERTIGRDQEVQLLNESVSKASSSTSIVHGLHGAGKTHLMRHWYQQSFTTRGRKAWYTCSNPLAHAQDFIKGLARELLLQLNPEEQNLINLLLKNRYGSDFDLKDWLFISREDGLKDGYVFLEILRAAKSADDTGILLVIDEGELLSPESRRLIRLIAEWKPLGTYLYINVATEAPGRQGLVDEFGSDWFFKGTSYIEVLPLPDSLSQDYLNLWSVQEIQGDYHFMDYASFQKRAWIAEQAEADPKLRGLLCHLAHHPYGLPHQFNPAIEEYEELIAQKPQLTEILRMDETTLAFGDLSYIYDLNKHFPEEFTKATPSLPEGESDWHRFQKAHLSLTQNGDSLDALEELARFYALTASVTPLKELLESTPIFGAHHKIWLKTAEFGCNFADSLADEVTQEVYSVAQEEPMLVQLLCSILARCRSLFRLLQPTYRDLSLKLGREHLFQAAEYHPEETLKRLESLKPSEDYFQEADTMIGWFFMDGSLTERQSFKVWPLAGEFAHAIREHESGENEAALKRLNKLEPQTLKSGDRHLHSRVLERISAVHDTMGNFDARLAAYRDAVISSVFAP